MALKKSKLTRKNESANLVQDQRNQLPTSCGKLLDLEHVGSKIIENITENSTISRECGHCKTLYSPIWRVGPDDEILCNACGLYWNQHKAYRSLEINSNRLSVKALHASKNSTIEPSISDTGSTSRRFKEREAKRKLKSLSYEMESESRLPLVNRVGKPIVPVKCSLLQTFPLPLCCSLNSPKAKSLLHHDILLFEGDHIVIRGSDSMAYFAIIEEFKVNESGDRLFRFSWLLPKPDYTEQILRSRSDEFDPQHYKIGPKGVEFVSVDVISNVLYSPQRKNFDLAFARFRKDSSITSEEVSVFDEVEAAHFLCDL